MKVTRNKLLRPTVVAVTTALVLTGCSVAPDKLTKQEINNVIVNDKALLYKGQVPIKGELSLSDVMARALFYNMEHRTQRMAQAVALGQFELAKFDLMPTLAAQSGIQSRNNVNASRSISVFNGNETLEPSTSQEQEQVTSDLSFSWNILDFGVSYFQAKQEADRYLISDESRKKVLLALLHQAQNAYWQAVTAQQLEEPVEKALKQSSEALEDIEKGMAAGAYPNILQPLQLKRQLLKAITELETLQESLNQARAALANIINIPLEQFPRLKEPERSALPEITASIEEMELIALQNSSDLAEQIYSTRIERLETRKAILRLLPGIEFNYNIKYDDNEFLHNNHWNEASLRVTWNLLRLASTGQTLKNADVREQLAEQRRLAVTMAVVTQLNLSLQEYKAAQKRLHKAEALKQIDQQIARHTTNNARASNASLVEQITTEVGALRSRLDYMQALAGAQDAYSSVFVSLGLSPVPDSYQLYELDALSDHIGSKLSEWRDGELEVYPLEEDISDES